MKNVTIKLPNKDCFNVCLFQWCFVALIMLLKLGKKETRAENLLCSGFKNSCFFSHHFISPITAIDISLTIPFTSSSAATYEKSFWKTLMKVFQLRKTYPLESFLCSSFSCSLEILQSYLRYPNRLTVIFDEWHVCLNMLYFLVCQSRSFSTFYSRICY